MQENVARADRSRAIPFDAAKLDRLSGAAPDRVQRLG